MTSALPARSDGPGAGARRASASTAASHQSRGVARSNEIDCSTSRAYAMMVNGGREIKGQLVERIRTASAGRSCAATSGSAGLPEARLGRRPAPGAADTRAEVIDPRHAFQMVAMRKGWSSAAPHRGTAHRQAPGRQDRHHQRRARDAWFVGFSPISPSASMSASTGRAISAGGPRAAVAFPSGSTSCRRPRGAPATPFRTPPGVRLCGSTPRPGFCPATAPRPSSPRPSCPAPSRPSGRPCRRAPDQHHGRQRRRRERAFGRHAHRPLLSQPAGSRQGSTHLHESATPCG